jgi:hypothetical protein
MRSRVSANSGFHQDPALRRLDRLAAVCLVIALVCAGGCRTVVREVQRSEAKDAPEVLAFDGSELVLATYLWADAPPEKSSGFLRGQLTVSDRRGKPVPRTLRLYHFQLVRPAFGSWLSNFPVTGERAWIAKVSPDIVCEFRADDKKRPVTTYDVVVSMTDAAGNRYALKAVAQPVHREAPSRRPDS